MKYLLTALLAFSLPFQAFAMVTPFFVTTATNPNNVNPRFQNLGVGGGAGSLATDNVSAVPVAINGTFGNLYASITVAPGVGTSYAFTVMKNNVATAITCTISGTNTSCNDTSDTVAVVPGNGISIRVTPTATPSVNGQYKISVALTGTNADEAIVAGGTSNTITATSQYFFLNGGASSAIEASTTLAFPTDGTIDDFYATTSSNITATFTLDKNLGATTVTCSMTANKQCNDTTHSFSVVAGDTVDLNLNSSTAAGSPQWSFRFRPTVDGEAPIFGNATTNFFNGRLQRAQGLGGNVVAESSTTALVPTNVTFKKGIILLDVAPGIPTSRGWLSRINSLTGNINVNVANNNVLGQDTTNSDPANAGDTYDIESTLSGGVNVNNIVRYAVVAFTPPASTAATHIQAFFGNLQAFFGNGTFIFY